MPKVTPEDIFSTQDGSHSVLSRAFGVPYHSKYGAIQESQHVFINSGLLYKLRDNPTPLKILEYGFGTGLNAYLSYLLAEKHQKDILYVGVEAFPLDAEVVSRLNYAEQIGQNPSPLQELHTCDWGLEHQMGSYFHFKKLQDKIESFQTAQTFDVLFFDAFAPSSQPELWDLPVLQKSYDLLNPGGALVTYCAKGAFKRNLRAAGFKVEALPGPPGKREMTRAIK
jgi:tRNA U34 5-methylaminomethyl-2-thiouridine-forming methyltransferase MnmC